MRKLDLFLSYICIIGWIASCSTGAFLGSSGEGEPYKNLGIFLFVAAAITSWTVGDEKKDKSKKD